MQVDRCVCWDQTFAELQRIARAGDLGFDQLVERTGCCTGCTTCEPYVKRMLRTGETEFPVLNASEVRRELDEHDRAPGRRQDRA
jgi:bacterioferritin-associated ferredoxin